MPIFPSNLCGVGRDGNVGVPAIMFDTWANLGNLGGWTLKMLAFDSKGTKYGVGTDGNIGRWLDMQWLDSGYDGWTVDCLTFDNEGRPWCVGTQGNVGAWNDGAWRDFGRYMGGWDMAWIHYAPITS